MHLNPDIDALLRSMNHASLPGIDLSLARMWQLLAALRNPQQHVPPVIHLAGTNGKGSTLAFLRAIFAAAGQRAHSYTSPHLVRFNERIYLAGCEISDAQLLPLLQQVAAAHIPATFFEATTAAAFLAFAQHAADILLLETGLGGRLDATNVVARPRATVITPIGFDHQEFLGNTLAAIAAEKAGIMKPDVPCVVGAQPPEVVETLVKAAHRIGCPLLLHGRDWEYHQTAEGFTLHIAGEQFQAKTPALIGPHQFHNAALALASAHMAGLALSPAVLASPAQARWPARLQPLHFGPLVKAWNGSVYLDGGHNPHAAQMLADWIAPGKVAMIAGMMRRKDATAFFTTLQPYISALVTVPIAGEDAYEPEALAAIARGCGIAFARPAASPAEALPLLQECHDQPLLIAGSLFLAGEILKNHG